MSVFKIAWRSIQHRGLGSWLTIISMALGVMMVVAVLSIHGLVSKSFKSNNSFGYNVLVGARGGGLQLTMNTVYYLSQPVENIPYEYYLAFENVETRGRELKHSIAYNSMQHEANSQSLAMPAAPGSGGLAATLAQRIAEFGFQEQQTAAMRLNERGLYQSYVHAAVPLCLGDFYVDEKTNAKFRCAGTKPAFFSELVLDVETESKFEFSEGRNFQEDSPEFGLYECVIGSTVARRCGLKLGDTIKPTHGDPSSAGAHIHDTPFSIVGIVAATGTPNDKVVFLNMEGFYLMDGHTKPITEARILKTADDEPVMATEESTDGAGDVDSADQNEANPTPALAPNITVAAPAGSRLPIEQREVTSILVRTSKNDEFNTLSMFLPAQLNEGGLETTLDWSPYRPDQAQKSYQAVNPIDQVTRLFEQFVDPIQWVFLALTCMICIVSALSILVGIYNSMSQRQHEIAVMRALGASRTKVMLIMLCEALLLALAGGLLGWIAGHGLNLAVSPWVDAQTGVQVGFFDFAPGIPLGRFPLASSLPNAMVQWTVSPEFLLIPALMLLAVLVGIYPAISAYRTDVSKSLGK